MSDDKVSIYLSSAWSRRHIVAALAKRLSPEIRITDRWFESDDIEGQVPDIVLCAAGRREMDAVHAADALVILEPGRRGAYIEVGVALACDKPVIVLFDDKTMDDVLSCPFYQLLNVTRWYVRDTDDVEYYADFLTPGWIHHVVVSQKRHLGGVS
jgi:nucleoside 2-deoxyribosyltransferase